MSTDNPHGGWRDRMHEIIFEADTRAGKIFDVALIASILASVAAIMLDSIGSINAAYGDDLYLIEWFFTILFTIEYIARLISVGRPLKYATSFFGAVDLLAIIPTYLSVLVPGSQYLLTIRVLRVLRVFRVFKLAQYVGEARMLTQALRASGRKITVFLFTVLTSVVVMGSLIYLVEGREHGFTSIPRAIYWAIVTLTTVGYGDISPQTPLGQAIASVVMIMGYGIIAVPTGIVTVELTRAEQRRVTTRTCGHCGKNGHDRDAVHCKFCGGEL